MKSYGDSCGIARALDVVGERWSLLLVRELLLGPKRYTDLQGALRGISPDVLSQRLRNLETEGIVQRGALPPPAASRVYELTSRGRGLEPVLHSLGRWGSAQPFPPGRPALGVDAAMVALPTLFRSDDGPPLTVELRVPEPFSARVNGELTLERGPAPSPEVVIEASPSQLAAVLWHGAPPSELVVSGSRRAARRFLKLFPLPA